jgi:S-DNA-T family DNA segregation ATPase FtsK/SpoIIIE
MNNSPEDLRIVMVDPKMVELVRFNGLPHLMGKVEVELERIQGVLKWVINEMDTRYKLFAEIHARDLNAYNKKMERQDIPTLPRIVLIIDELADLMMNAPTQTEPALVRLAQLARATGIHLIVATQRPSTDVVTGLIKANFPARIAFAVASNTDSRVILDTPGAENLLGRGDMLFLNPEVGTPIRAQGVMVSDEEIDKIIQHWQNELPDKLENSAPWEMMLEEEASGGDELIQQAIEIIKQTRKASASLLQRRLRIGYPRAASLIDELEDMGIIGPATGAGREREVLIDSDPDEYEEP